MSRPDDVEALAELAVERLGTVDIWINNAGQVSARARDGGGGMQVWRINLSAFLPATIISSSSRSPESRLSTQVTGKKLLADVPPEEVVQAVGANVLGSLLGRCEWWKRWITHHLSHCPV